MTDLTTIDKMKSYAKQASSFTDSDCARAQQTIDRVDPRELRRKWNERQG